MGSSELTNATALGSQAFVTQNNSLVLGSINGINGASADTNVGIGLTAPQSRLDVAGNINTSTQYNIGGQRVLGVPATDNTFVGLNAGQANAGGGANAFFGRSTGSSNTTGGNNAFFGSATGRANTLGSSNAFFGSDSGLNNTTGDKNSFFGRAAGNVSMGPEQTPVGNQPVGPRSDVYSLGATLYYM